MWQWCFHGSKRSVFFIKGVLGEACIDDGCSQLFTSSPPPWFWPRWTPSDLRGWSKHLSSHWSILGIEKVKHVSSTGLPWWFLLGKYRHALTSWDEDCTWESFSPNPCKPGQRGDRRVVKPVIRRLDFWCQIHHELGPWPWSKSFHLSGPLHAHP